MHNQFSKMVLIAAPSGAGKTSIVKHLLARVSDLSFSVSATTRLPRIGEANGRDYYFITLDCFKSKIQNQDFLEWEMVYKDMYYGTPKSELERIWKEHKVPLLEIDVQGAIKVITTAKSMGAIGSVYAIFLRPPSIEVLRERLIKRGTDPIGVIEDRIKKASFELTLATPEIFQSIIVNDDWQTCAEEVYAKVSAYLAS